MKKYLRLSLAAVLAACVLSLSSPQIRVWASTEGSYIYHQLIVVGLANLPAGTFGIIGTQNGTGTGNTAFPSYVAQVGGESNPECSPYTGETGALGLNVSSTIVVACGFETVISSGSGSVLITAVPSISTTTIFAGANAIPSGYVLTLVSTAAAGVVLQDAGTLSGSGLALGAATRTVTKTKTLTLQWEPSLARWVELSFGNNQGN